MGKMFEEVQIGQLKLKNRMMRGATWENLATDDGKLTDELYKVYEELVLFMYLYLAKNGGEFKFDWPH